MQITLYLRPVYKLDKLKRKQRDAVDVFHQTKAMRGFNPGDSVLVQDLLFVSKFEKGIVLGLNNNEVFVQKGNGYEIASYGRISKIK